ncbi:toll/interleukin-1 receptor domain-containing protein [Derxia lacustris]|uniref:toll/interleukin-1 receptor domain-containing protein n=1 Tax=Derxia lacustris TaxID=764842 RepID=UPI000A17610D|nr:toll/interleukin-1 receptor domain-containing protein [Derxia lacustris]
MAFNRDAYYNDLLKQLGGIQAKQRFAGPFVAQLIDLISEKLPGVCIRNLSEVEIVARCFADMPDARVEVLFWMLCQLVAPENQHDVRVISEHELCWIEFLLVYAAKRCVDENLVRASLSDVGDAGYNNGSYVHASHAESELLSAIVVAGVLGLNIRVSDQAAVFKDAFVVDVPAKGGFENIILVALYNIFADRSGKNRTTLSALDSDAIADLRTMFFNAREAGRAGTVHLRLSAAAQPSSGQAATIAMGVARAINSIVIRPADEGMASIFLQSVRLSSADLASRIRWVVGGIHTARAVNNSKGKSGLQSSSQAASRDMVYDLFVSHASKDCKSFVDDLVAELRKRGRIIWYAKEQLKNGDDVAQGIDKGLKASKFVLAVLSKNYFVSGWAMAEVYAELDFSKSTGRKRVLLVRLNMSQEKLYDDSRLFYALLSANSEDGMANVVDTLESAMSPAQ